jgi:hypothetical protein
MVAFERYQSSEEENQPPETVPYFERPFVGGALYYGYPENPTGQGLEPGTEERELEDSLIDVIAEEGSMMNVGDLLDRVKETYGPETMGKAALQLYKMAEQQMVFMCDDANEGRVTVGLYGDPKSKRAPIPEFKTEKWARNFSIGEEDPDYDLVEDFDSHLPSNPKPADWHAVAKLTGNSRLLRNRAKMQTLANEVDKLRFERRIRKHIHEYLEQKGGTAGIVEIMSSVDARDGQAAANAAISLIHIMKAEGKVDIYFAPRPYDVTIGEERFKGMDDQIIVRLLRRRK